MAELKGNKKTARGTKTPERIGVKAAAKDRKQSVVQLIKRTLTNAAPMPSDLEPMLATLTDKPFDHPGWLFEIKWDGYRAMAYMDDEKVHLRSRRNLPYNDQYPTIVAALKEWNIKAVVDGEIVVLTPEGKADFEALQNWGRKKDLHLVYYVFDLLWLDGYDVSSLPLQERKDILKKIVPENSVIRYSESIEETGTQLYDLAVQNELEGIIAKRSDSIYRPGKRSSDWLKMPATTRQEFVVGGWVESDSGRPFKSLLFGYYNNGALQYFHHGGGGFKDRDMEPLLKQFKKLEIGESPFVNPVDYDGVFHWMKPQLVATFKYSKLTKSGKIRHPAIFQGWRNDKEPQEVTLDKPVRINPQDPLTPGAPGQGSKKTNAPGARLSSESNWKILHQIKVTSSMEIPFGDRIVQLTNIERPLWKGVLQSDLLQYYHSVADLVLPHLHNRPLSLHVKHNGPQAAGLYIKDMEGQAPAWAQLFTVPRRHAKIGKRHMIDYLVCNDEATLQYCINLGAIDMNPWTATTLHPEEPDFIVIDLDPSDEDFTKVIECAMAAGELFKKHRLRAFPKTSGKTGMHIFIPCKGFSFPEARRIAETICKAIQAEVPAISTTEVSVSQRGTKLYLDPNQNDYADTVAAVYSVRPYKLPTVSTPLTWKEIRPGLDPHAFTLHTIGKRLDKAGDLFEGVLLEKNQLHNRRYLQTLL